MLKFRCTSQIEFKGYWDSGSIYTRSEQIPAFDLFADSLQAAIRIARACLLTSPVLPKPNKKQCETYNKLYTDVVAI